MARKKAVSHVKRRIPPLPPYVYHFQLRKMISPSAASFVWVLRNWRGGRERKRALLQNFMCSLLHPAACSTALQRQSWLLYWLLTNKEQKQACCTNKKRWTVSSRAFYPREGHSTHGILESCELACHKTCQYPSRPRTESVVWKRRREIMSCAFLHGFLGVIVFWANYRKVSPGGLLKGNAENCLISLR